MVRTNEEFVGTQYTDSSQMPLITVRVGESDHVLSRRTVTIFPLAVSAHGNVSVIAVAGMGRDMALYARTCSTSGAARFGDRSFAWDFPVGSVQRYSMIAKEDRERFHHF